MGVPVLLFDVNETLLDMSALDPLFAVAYGDVAARLTHARFAVLVEGAAPGEASATVATRILVAGLKEPLPAARAEYLRFRIVLAGVPTEEVPPKLLLQALNARMDQELRVASERRIVTLTQEELTAAFPWPQD